MTVHQLTEAQAHSLMGNEVFPGNTFHPIQDADWNWIISNEEVDQCENKEFQWVKNLPEIDFKPNETTE